MQNYIFLVRSFWRRLEFRIFFVPGLPVIQFFAMTPMRAQVMTARPPVPAVWGFLPHGQLQRRYLHL